MSFTLFGRKWRQLIAALTAAGALAAGAHALAASHGKPTARSSASPAHAVTAFVDRSSWS